MRAEHMYVFVWTARCCYPLLTNVAIYEKTLLKLVSTKFTVLSLWQGNRRTNVMNLIWVLLLWLGMRQKFQQMLNAASWRKSDHRIRNAGPIYTDICAFPNWCSNMTETFRLLIPCMITLQIQHLSKQCTLFNVFILQHLQYFYILVQHVSTL
jgi:hypothetical protein